MKEQIKTILQTILTVIKYFCRWMWEKHWVWTTLIIATVISIFFVHPLMAFFCFAVCAIPGAFVSWAMWYDKRK